MSDVKIATSRQWRVADDSQTHSSIRINGLDWGGDGPVALLHHANGFCAAVWDPMVQLLGSHYRVIAIDARGHGDSDSPTLPEGANWGRFADDLATIAEQILNETGSNRIHYGIGSSFGGTIMAAVEARRPNTFARIVMFDPPLQPSDECVEKLKIDPAIIEFAREGLADQARKRRAIWPSRLAAKASWKNKPAFQSWSSEVFDLYVNECFKDLPDGNVSLKCRPALEAAVYQAITSIDALEIAARVACPALLVHASRGFFPKAIHDLFASRMSSGSCYVADSGHLVPLEAPALCAQLLIDFDSWLSKDR